MLSLRVSGKDEQDVKAEAKSCEQKAPPPRPLGVRRIRAVLSKERILQHGVGE